MIINISPTAYGGYAVRWTEGGNLHTRYALSHYEALIIREEIADNNRRQYEGGIDYEVVEDYDSLGPIRLEF